MGTRVPERGDFMYKKAKKEEKSFMPVESIGLIMLIIFTLVMVALAL
ncbi:MAG: hypothetical protein J6Y02_02620 [Pseudobutyrivibrio sp.]|nr:hypothetical protein [Pseudobutyrivibrio sp.]